MKRRAFLTLLGGAAAWPMAAQAQQGERMRRIGVLMNLAADDSESPVRIAAFMQGLQQSGWIDGRNVRIDYRWAAADAERRSRYAAESLFSVELSPIDDHDAGEIEGAITAFARLPNGGLIITSGILAAAHRQLIVTLAARYRLPAVYPFRYHVASGGLVSYGPDTIDQYRRAAGYVDRILKGEKPADLPVQAPTKYELVINLKTAKALGLDVPPTLLARADEVIE
jgi:hypothetical protein